MVVGAMRTDDTHRLDPSCDGLHRVGPEPWWREAWYFEFFDPCADLQFQVYQGVFPNASTGDVNAAVFHQGSRVYELRKMDFRVLAEPEAERLCFGPMKIEPIEALRKWRIRFDAGEFCADFTFSALHPPFSWPAVSNRQKSGAGPAMRSHHFDQLGRYQGTCLLQGRELAIDTLGFRDRMWGWGGRRHWRSYLIMWAAFHEDCVANVAVQSFDDGRETLSGYLHLDGIRSLLQSARVDVRWDPWRWKSIAEVDVSIQDQSGRNFEFSGQPRGILDTGHRWPHRNDHMLFSVGQYRHGDLGGHGVMNWAFSSAADQRERLEAEAWPVSQDQVETS